MHLKCKHLSYFKSVFWAPDSHECSTPHLQKEQLVFSKGCRARTWDFMILQELYAFMSYSSSYPHYKSNCMKLKTYF